jgi:23S rRNA (cytosine1962-C5)-methyltransferase
MTDGPRRVAVRVTPDARRHLRAGHPWVFDRSITSAPDDARPGDLAVVFDHRRRFVAIGLWDPHSPIRVKVLHAGEPTPIDDAFWLRRVQDAADRRRALVADGTVTGYRCLHGENDAMPGLVLDRYGDVLVCKAYTGAWLAHLDAVVAAVERVWSPASVVLRTGRRAAAAFEAAGIGEGATLAGTAPAPAVDFLENGLRFTADVRRGQKTGWFLDQRDNRRRVRDWCSRHPRARVLDVYCCNGGFSVHAAAGGAAEVHSVDASPLAVASARHHVSLNSGDPTVAVARHETTVGDATEAMAAMARRGRRFDLVVVDPPSFAHRASQVPGALDAYARLAGLAVGLVADGGTLAQFSCSSRVDEQAFLAALHRGASAAGARLEVDTVTGHAVDHPVGFAEGAYLKGAFATVSHRQSSRRGQELRSRP